MNQAHIKVSGNETGRLDKYLSQKFPHVSRSRFQGLIKKGHVQVENHPVKAHASIQPGQIITINWPSPRAIHPKEVPEELPPILFEDDTILIVNKPAGMVVHPSAGHFSGDTLVEILEHKLAPGGWTDQVRPGVVHRLDRDTSGVMLMAKTPQAQTHLSRQFMNRQVKKVYLGLVWGIPPAKGTLESMIGRDHTARKKFAVRTEGRWASTQFLVKKKLGHVASVVELRPLTGRTHQLRVHLAHYGYPIVGDKIYGNPRKEKDINGISRQMLHANKLSFKHPRTQKTVRFEAPMPKDFLEAMKLMRFNA
jgi:23S rRNA pseudouridine1911/1915/1917 synthase